MNKKTILYITELFPYPPVSGAKIKTFNTIQTLSKKFNIVLFCFNQNQPNKSHILEIEKYVTKIHIFNLPTLDSGPKDDIFKLFKNYFFLKSYFLYQTYSHKAKIEINKLIKKHTPDIIHIDHLNMAQYLPKNKEQIWIYEEHNIESELAWTKFTAFNSLKKTKLFLFFEWLLIRNFERNVVKRFDHIFTISNHDKQALNKLTNTFKITTQTVVYLPGTQGKKIDKPARLKTIIFVGDLTWEPNKTGVLWFIHRVFPLILHHEPHTVFKIIGNIEPSFAQQIRNKRNVQVLGFQKKLQQHLTTADIFALPFLSGGGVRIKALTAFANNLPVVTTTKGIQGLELTNYKECIIAQTQKQFALHTILLLRNPKLKKQISLEALQYLKANHSQNNNNLHLKKYIAVTQESP